VRGLLWRLELEMILKLQDDHYIKTSAIESVWTEDTETQSSTFLRLPEPATYKVLIFFRSGRSEIITYETRAGRDALFNEIVTAMRLFNP
jgi:hypothetical protein